MITGITRASSNNSLEHKAKHQKLDNSVPDISNNNSGNQTKVMAENKYNLLKRHLELIEKELKREEEDSN